MELAAAQVFDALAMCVCSLHGFEVVEAEFSFASARYGCCAMLALVSSFVSRVPVVVSPEAETYRPLDKLDHFYELVSILVPSGLLYTRS
jgi:hypothetical protein